LIFCLFSAQMQLDIAEFVSCRIRRIAGVMSDIDVEVLDDALRVTRPGASLAVTFQRIAQWRMLEARELLTAPSISALEASFAAEAWKAAYSEAKALGWL
jgi:hypothetical protein